MSYNKKSIVFIIISSIFFSTNAYEFKKNEFIQHLSNQANASENETFIVKSITFTSDTKLSKEEFFYLTNLKSKIYISLNDLWKSYKNLKRKQRFSQIDIKIKNTLQGRLIHFDIKSNWMFKNIKVKGVLFGKNQYEQLYLQHPGDIFDIQLHEKSIFEIKNFLYEQGYFYFQLDDEIIYRQTDKTISVDIKIKRGNRFKLKNIKFEVFYDSSINENLSRSLNKKCNQLIRHKHFSKNLINRIKNRCKLFINKRDFYVSKISCKYLINKEKKSIEVTFRINASNEKKFQFTGNKFFSGNYLIKNIIEKDKPNWLLTPEIISEQILHEYYKNGFWHTKIKFQKLSNNEYEFSINEGERTIIKQVIVENSEKFFKKVTDHKYYNEDLLNKCIKNLEDYYLENGFLDFKIINRIFTKNPTDNSFTITLLIDQGKQRFLKETRVVLITKKQNISEFSFLKNYENHIETPIPLNLNLVASQREKMLRQLHDLGYWHSKLDLETKIKNLSGNIEKITLIWQITPSEKIKFGKVFFRGNTNVPFKKILNEIEFKEDEKWSKEKLDRSMRNLKNLKVFKQIQIHPQKLSKEHNQKPISITLIDDDPIEMRMRAGYFLTNKNFIMKKDSTAKIGGSLIFKNPLNLADIFSINGDFTRFEKRLNIDYKIPQTFNSKTDSEFKGYYNKYHQITDEGKIKSNYEVSQKGGLVGLIKEFEVNSYYGINLGREQIRTKKISPNIKFSNDLLNKTIPNFFIEPNFLVDKTDNKINPSKGFINFTSIKWMIPDSKKNTSIKFILDQSIFYPIAKKFIAALRFRSGHIFIEKFENISPAERFYLGGPLSVRGYEKDALPPLGENIEIVNGKKEKTYTIQGGSSMINFNFEVRLPLYKDFGGVLFNDIGILSQSGFYGYKKWHPTFGCGLRYQTPIGPIRFDIGWKTKKSFPEDSSYTWYLTIGQAF